MSMKSSTYGSRCHGEYFGCMSSPKNVLIEGLEIYETPTKWATGGTHSPWQLISGAGNVDKKQSDSTNWGWYWAVSCLFRLVYQGVCITLQAVRMKKVNKFGGTPKSDKAPQILGKQTTRDQLSCAGREYYIYMSYIYMVDCTSDQVWLPFKTNSFLSHSRSCRRCLPRTIWSCCQPCQQVNRFW